jgi:hypothetical protein
MRRNDDLEREVATIRDLSREELVARWHKTYRCAPPKGVNRSLLERSAAWHLQAKKLGGLSAAARAALRVASRAPARSSGSTLQSTNNEDVGRAETRSASSRLDQDSLVAIQTPAIARLVIGTRLMREWNGRIHVVDVTEQGILFDGKIYRSLSSVAKRITGAHWSGPRFFGL